MISLIAIRIGTNYGVLSGQLLCLNAKYHVQFYERPNKEAELIISKNQNFIEDFFGSRVSSVTGIVGKNGVGKSTLLRYIKDLFVKEKTELQFREDDIIIFEDHGTIKLFLNESRKGLLKISNSTNSEIEQRYYRGYPKIYDQIKNFNTTYYSNTLELDQKEEETSNYFNISTSYLLENIGKINSKLKNKRIRNQNAHARFRFTELKRQINFLQTIGSSNELLDIPFKRLNEIELNIKEVSQNDYSRLLKTLRSSLLGTGREKESNSDMAPEGYENFYKWAAETVKKIEAQISDRKKTEFEAITLSYSKILIYENLLFLLLHNLFEDLSFLLLTDLSGNYLSILKTAFESFLNFNNIQLSVAELTNDLKDRLQKLEISKFPEEDLQISFHKKEAVFEELIDFESFIFPFIESGRSSGNSILFDPSNPVMDDMLNRYFSSSLNFKFVAFKWPKLSAGEESLIAFFSRLHSISRESRVDNLLLLIDEGDLYFHPEWQRKYMFFLLKYLSSSYIHFTNIQLLITTHSPFIVSDLPSDCVIFLDRSNDDKVSVISPEKMGTKTFGGNLHTLYSKAFFLGSSTISEFALQKIRNDVMKAIENPAIDLNEDLLQKIINEIGEPVLKSALLERLNNRRNDSNS
jgi:hypothetical protein